MLRSLTSNPRLNEIVDVVKRLNNAFQKDAGIPGNVTVHILSTGSSYLIINPRLKNPRGFSLFSNFTEEYIY